MPRGATRAKRRFSRSFGGPGADIAFHALQTSDGGHAFIGGYGSNNAAWFGKLDANGDLEWQTSFTQRAQVGSLIEADDVRLLAAGPAPDGGFCLTGRADGADGDAADVYVGRLDASYNLVWEVRFDSGGWAGYALAPGGGQPVAAALDAGQVTAAAGDGSCLVVAYSSANLPTSTSPASGAERRPLVFTDASGGDVAMDAGGDMDMGADVDASAGIVSHGRGAPGLRGPAVPRRQPDAPHGEGVLIKRATTDPPPRRRPRK